MLIFIDEGLDIPVYRQIRNQIVIGISNGSLLPGERLPTVRALAQEIGINSMTANKAYQLLKQEGYIFTDKRNGARVRDNFACSERLNKEAEEQLKKIISEAKISGMSKADFLKKCEYYYGEENVL